MSIPIIDYLHTETGQSSIETERASDRLGRQYAFQCSEYFHLAELSPICSLIYGLAYKLTKSGKTKLFASAESIGEYIDRSPDTVRRGFRELEGLGFLKLERSCKFRPNEYRVLSHKDWITTHPRQCCEKLIYSYTDEGDPLGRELYSITSGRIRFHKFQIDSYRKLGLPEDRIIEVFREFWESTGQTISPGAVSPYFHKILESRSRGE